MRIARETIAGLVLVAMPIAAYGGEVKISDARKDDHGFLVHAVNSPFQAGQTEIRVLLPNRLEEGERYPVVYVLPVEPGRGIRYGDGLLEVHKHDLHNKHRVVFVGPTFSDWPWYGDHPGKPDLRQESYFLHTVVPFVERTYPVSNVPKDRLLLGFSKSGWGAWSLLLRHSETFGRAAAWDAPLMMETIGKYGTSETFGTQANFEKYRPADLLRTRADQLRADNRLILAGYGNFRAAHQQAHELLDQLQIPHEYRDGPPRKHDWHSGWVTETVELLLRRPADSPERQP